MRKYLFLLASLLVVLTLVLTGCVQVQQTAPPAEEPAAEEPAAEEPAAEEPEDEDDDFIDDIEIEVETGHILNWKKPTKKELQETFGKGCV